jgi:hypothetical protein
LNPGHAEKANLSVCGGDDREDQLPVIIGESRPRLDHSVQT